MVEYIYYTGIGAKKNGKHSIKEFLNIMNKNSNVECSEYLTDLNYKPCSQYKEMNKKTMKYNIKHKKPIFFYNNRTCKQHEKYKKIANNCLKYKNKKTTKNKTCNLDEYIKFSGAEKKKEGFFNF
jgi:hypothetical protein